MGSQDLALRKTAIPYYANVWGYNRSEDSDYDISAGTYVGDLSSMIPSSLFQSTAIGTVNPIRILQPQYGDIVEANLNIKFRTANAEGARKFRIAIGKFNGLYDRETSYSDDYITESHRQLTGHTVPFDIPPASTFTLPRLNLYPGMYHRGDAEFRDDAFVLLLVFDQAPSKGTGYSFTKFEINCTAQMGLL